MSEPTKDALRRAEALHTCCDECCHTWKYGEIQTEGYTKGIPICDQVIDTALAIDAAVEAAAYMLLIPENSTVGIRILDADEKIAALRSRRNEEPK